MMDEKELQKRLDRARIILKGAGDEEPTKSWFQGYVKALEEVLGK